MFGGKMEWLCKDCGARYENENDSCARRFEQLLALDHSHQEPWGSRHGLAFAVFALQHPSQYGASTRARSLELLERVFLRQEPIQFVIRELRARGRGREERSDAQPPPLVGPFAYTIADCGSFEAEDYVAHLEKWCRATLNNRQTSS